MNGVAIATIAGIGGAAAVTGVGARANHFLRARRGASEARSMDFSERLGVLQRLDEILQSDLPRLPSPYPQPRDPALLSRLEDLSREPGLMRARLAPLPTETAVLGRVDDLVDDLLRKVRRLDMCGQPANPGGEAENLKTWVTARAQFDSDILRVREELLLLMKSLRLKRGLVDSWNNS